MQHSVGELIQTCKIGVEHFKMIKIILNVSAENERFSDFFNFKYSSKLILYLIFLCILTVHPY